MFNISQLTINHFNTHKAKVINKSIFYNELSIKYRFIRN